MTAQEAREKYRLFVYGGGRIKENLPIDLSDTVVGKESVVADSVPFTVIFKDLLLMGDTIGFKLFFIFSLVFFIKIIDRKTAIKSRN